MIKILHIVENYSFSSGGIRTVVKNLTEELSNENYTSFILTSRKEKEDKSAYVVNSDKKPWLYSKEWKVKIHEICSEKKIDCIHIHGTWMFPQFIASKYAIKNNIPFIITAHGMFEPWLWEQGKFKKKFYFNFFTKKYFSKATVVHSITGEETKNLKKLFINGNIEEIPNLIKEQKEDLNLIDKKEKYILYIGRLDEKKGIDLLIKSFIKINPKNVKLKIAGEFNVYKNNLEKIIESSNIDSNNIEFLGFVEAEAKHKLIKNAFVLAAPSHSEVIGMVNLEAAILKTPVITTYQTGLNKLWKENGGFLINPNQKELISSLEEVLKWSKEKQIEQGEKLYNFVLEKYTWKNRIEDWKKLYKSVL
ncbi:glycosyltransferase [Polaribacter atrinae]|uniref:glycosyltransferase n=1 Tax=Polaribacter atrinae TaxID=1333662 RepID=UPI0024920919|nr:glycosyltransferase [Polaribacter atrinae]